MSAFYKKRSFPVLQKWEVEAANNEEKTHLFVGVFQAVISSGTGSGERCEEGPSDGG